MTTVMTPLILSLIIIISLLSLLLLLVEREAKKLGQDHERITDLCIYLLIAAVVGSRLRTSTT